LAGQKLLRATPASEAVVENAESAIRTIGSLLSALFNRSF